MAVFETLFILTGLRMGLCLGEEYCNKIQFCATKGEPVERTLLSARCHRVP